MSKTGVLLTTFNDLDMSRVMYDSLPDCLDRDDHVVVVDAGSKDGSVEYWQQHYPVIHKGMSGDQSLRGRDPVLLGHLSVALNVGIDWLIDKDCEYVCWIHADMKFDRDRDWIRKLVNRLKEDQSIGKIHPATINDQNQSTGEEHPGNNCPWVMSRWTLLAIDMRRRQTMQRTRPDYHHEFYLESFIGIGGREDWDVNNNVMSLFKKVIITPDSVVWHKGMGTRERRDTDAEAIHNAGVYESIYGTTRAYV